MRIIFALSICLLLLTSCFNREADKKIEKTDKESLLWLIEKEGSPKSYLFGTMHLIDKAYYYMPDNLTNLIVSADKVVLEIGEKPGILDLIPLLKSDKGNIFDYFNESQKDSLYDYIENVMNKNPEKIEARFSQLKPMMLQQYLSTAAFPKKWESYEQDIYKLQKKAKAPFVGLETIEEQMNILNDLPMEKQAEEIMATIKSVDSAKQEFIEMSKLHRSGNISGLYELIAGSEGFDMAAQDNLLNNRNLNWIPKLTKIISKESAFIAVGAGHLGGNKGLIKLLEKEGYSLTPLSY